MEPPDKPDLSIHWTNWQTAESQPELTAELVQDEIDKGWLICFDGSLDDATHVSSGGRSWQAGHCNIRHPTAEIGGRPHHVRYQPQL